MSESRQTELPALLPRVWLAFLSRFGRPTRIQELTVPEVIQGKNVFVTAPTASGKTEAVFAPLAERLIQESWLPLSILYVVPTRALANDAFCRLDGPFRSLGLKVSIRHGDRPYIGKNEPDCLITTPESLDSLICRHSGLFGRVRAVVLDEIHLVDNCYRGDQLRLLLSRLQNVSLNRFSVCLLSATVSSPQEVAGRYADAVQVISVSGQRPLEFQIVSTGREVFNLARERRYKKLLCFCNSRQAVEILGSELAQYWNPYPVVVHHGSLSRQVREEAEKVMRECQVAVCVATSTLEIGVDIGDIDLVVLADPPWSISSLLQRIGRGNRRTQVTRAVGIATTEEESQVMTGMFEAARLGCLPASPYEADLSVLVQQTFSVLYQHPDGLREESLSALLRVLASPEDVEEVLSHLEEQEWIVERRGSYFASARLMDLGEKGKVHSNIPDLRSLTVIDSNTGRPIGRVTGSFDSVFLLGHRAWRIVSIQGDKINVVPFKGRASAPAFQPCRDVGAFWPMLPENLK